MDEIQFQRQRLHEIFDDMKKRGTCDNHCEICILCDNAGDCVAKKALRLLRESKTEDQSGTSLYGIIIKVIPTVYSYHLFVSEEGLYFHSRTYLSIKTSNLQGKKLLVSVQIFFLHFTRSNFSCENRSIQIKCGDYSLLSTWYDERHRP